MSLEECMARKAEQGALQYAASVTEVNPPRIGGAGFISGVFNDFLANPRLPFNRLTPIGRWLGYFWDSKVAPLALNFADGTNTLDSRITFSRSSNATVTDSNGNIVFAPHNLLTFSEQFDNAAWSKTSGTVTANAGVAPDGTTTADQIASTGAGVFRSSITVTQGALHTASVYAKNVSGGNNFIFGFDSGPASGRTTFNLQNGTVVSNDANVVSSSITAVGNGWYRCVVSAVTTSTSCILVYYNATSGANWLVWGAQLNQGSLQPYYPTTVKNLLGFSEAFDNAAWTKSNSFIQTNLLTFSEQFDNAAWTKGDSTIVANSTLAPNNAMTADKLVPNNAATIGRVRQDLTLADSTTYTISFYAKAGEFTDISVQFYNKANTFHGSRILNLSTGAFSGSDTLGTSSATLVGNGWYRFVFSGVTSATGATTPNIRIICTNTGDGTSGLFLWGAQLVQGASAGDYQQTTSTALPVMYQAPNGTMTADKLVEDTATSQHHIQQGSAVVGSKVTFSVYAKAAERSVIALTGAGLIGSSLLPQFNLTTGQDVTVGTSANMQTSITPVGNGWFRCSVTWIPTNTNPFQVTVLNAVQTTTSVSYTGNGTSGVLIWGSQLSDSASLDPYVNNPVAAPSSTAYYGPRFDYDPVTRQPRGLLIEESRANLLLRSEEFDNASWVKNGVTVSANSTTSPDGTVDADTLVEAAGTTVHRVRQTVAAGTYNVSVYVKPNGRNFFSIANEDAPTNWVVFNLSNGTVGTSGGSVSNATISAQSNGFYRVSVNITLGANGVYFHVRDADSIPTTYAGDESRGVFIWGAQVEAGAFPTSYIPTTTATVTRAADVAVIQGSNFSSWYNQDQGSIFAESQTLTTTGNAFAAQISDNSYNNRILVGQSSSSSVGQVIVSGSATLEPTSNPLRSSARIKQAFGFTTNSAQLATSGVLSVQDSSGAMVFGLTRLDLGSDHAGFNRLNGTISRINYYNRRLDNSQLQAITQ